MSKKQTWDPTHPSSRYPEILDEINGAVDRCAMLCTPGEEYMDRVYFLGEVLARHSAIVMAYTERDVNELETMAGELYRQVITSCRTSQG